MKSPIATPNTPDNGGGVGEGTAEGVEICVGGGMEVEPDVVGRPPPTGVVRPHPTRSVAIWRTTTSVTALDLTPRRAAMTLEQNARG
jgi:hypothetical protein